MAVTVREVLRDMVDAGTVELETGAGTLATDVLALVQFVDAAGIATPTPGTWTGPVGAVANGVRAAIHYRVVGGAGGATAVDANISGSPSNHAHLLVLAGADLPHADADTASGFDDTQTVPSQTGDDGGLQICGWVSDDAVTYTAPGSMTGGGQTQNNGFSTGFTAYEALTAGGATGTKAATVGSGKTFVCLGVTFPPAAAGGLDITPAAVTVTAGAGSLAISIGVVPAATTVTATAGAVAIGLGVPLTGPTISAAPGTLTITTTADITPAATAVTATPGAVTVVVGGATQDIIPATVVVTAGVGTLSMVAGITPSPVTITGTAGTLSMAVHVTPGSVVATVAAGTLALAADIPLAGATITAGPGTIAVGQGPAVFPASMTVTAVPGDLVITTADPPIIAAVTVAAVSLASVTAPRTSVATVAAAATSTATVSGG